MENTDKVASHDNGFQVAFIKYEDSEPVHRVPVFDPPQTIVAMSTRDPFPTEYETNV